MTEQEKPVRLTVQLDDRRLYRALRHLAIEQDRSLRDIVVEALREWVLKQEGLEELEVIRETEGEESYPWEQVKAERKQARKDERVA
ncbi:MAG: hypothetical protein ACYC66_03045 [Chloroflexota bacterium]